MLLILKSPPILRVLCSFYLFFPSPYPSLQAHLSTALARLTLVGQTPAEPVTWHVSAHALHCGFVSERRSGVWLDIQKMNLTLQFCFLFLAHSHYHTE